MRSAGVVTCLLAAACGAASGAVAQEPARPAMRLVGRVVDALGEPVPAAEVWVTENRLPVAQVRTEGSGAFLFPSLPPGTFEVHARGKGRTHRSAPVRLSEREPVRFVDLQLFDAAHLRGRLRGAGGAPLRNAIIGVRPTAAGFEDVEHVVTKGDGSWSLPHAPLGEIELLAFAGGHRVHRETLRLQNDLERELDLAPGAAFALRVHVEGAPEALLRQTTCSVALAHAGTPIALPAWRTSGRPDARGDFVLTDLPSDVQYRDADVRAPGGEFGAQWPVTTDARGVLVVPFRCVPGPQELRGNLVGGDGKPIAGSSVRLVLQSGEELLLPTGENGAFAVPSPLRPSEVFHLLPGDPRHAVAWTQGRRRAGVLPRPEPRYVPSQRHVLRVVEGTAVTGRLLDAEGIPAPGRVVMLDAPVLDAIRSEFVPVLEAVTDAAGRYRLVVDPRLDVPLRVRAAAPGMVRSDEFALEARGETALPDLRAPVLGRVDGTLRTAAGEPVAGAVVVLQAPKGASAVPLRTKTARDGRFAFADVPLGPRELGWTTSTGAVQLPADAEPFEVTTGAAVRRDLVAR